MISKWLHYRSDINNLHIGFILVLTSFAGGYMVSDFPKPFLDLFKTILGQFIVFCCINVVLIGLKKENIYWIVIESIISVILIRILKKILEYIYEKN